MANIYIKILHHTYRFDIINIALLFWPGSKISEDSPKGSDIRIYSSLDTKGDKLFFRARIRINGKDFRASKIIVQMQDDDVLKYTKQTVYKAAVKATGIRPPWGILTGIRPMNIYEKLIQTNSPEQTQTIFEKEYFTTRPKLQLLESIYNFRSPAYYEDVEKDVSLYISIPFCPSKCNYCSFVSSSVERVQNLIEPYLQLLMTEIVQKLELIRSLGKRVASVYVGGGTPGILSAEQIDMLLACVSEHLDKKALKELCFEIGRPETVTNEKLEVLQKYQVDRLCINCQTLNDNVLQKIGRRHTAAQFISALELAEKYSFKTINVDYIAGLPDEITESHLKSVQKAIKHGVQNITIHTLSIKRASSWADPDKLYDPASDTVSKMLEQDHELLQNFGYHPYYIYRQKSTLSNGENIGFSKNGHIGLYNIYMMEDVHSVIGCGAGASTKIICSENGRIERFFNNKYPQDYVKDPQKLSDTFLAVSNALKGNS